MLLNITNSRFDTSLHRVIVSHYNLEDNVIVSTIFLNVLGHKFLCAIHSKVFGFAACSIDESHEQMKMGIAGRGIESSQILSGFIYDEEKISFPIPT